MKGTRDTAAFAPSDAMLRSALQTWHAERDSMEVQFFRSRVPVQ